MGDLINTVRFADDMALLSKSQGSLQSLVEELPIIRKSLERKLNVKKIKLG